MLVPPPTPRERLHATHVASRTITRAQPRGQRDGPAALQQGDVGLGFDHPAALLVERHVPSGIYGPVGAVLEGDDRHHRSYSRQATPEGAGAAMLRSSVFCTYGTK